MDYFTRLAQQALGGQAAEAVRPRLPGRFEPGGVPQHAPAAPKLRAELAAAPDTAFESPPTHMRRDASMERTIAPAPRPPAEAAPGHTEAAPRHTEAAPGHTEAAPRHTEAVPRHTEAAPRHTEAHTARSETGPAVAPASPLRGVAIAPALAAPAPGGVRSQTDAAPPVIRVSIGRVEVRAVVRPAAPPPRPAASSQPAAAPLDDYLRADKGGRPR